MELSKDNIVDMISQRALDNTNTIVAGFVSIGKRQVLSVASDVLPITNFSSCYLEKMINLETDPVKRNTILFKRMLVESTKNSSLYSPGLIFTDFTYKIEDLIDLIIVPSYSSRLLFQEPWNKAHSHKEDSRIITWWDINRAKWIRLSEERSIPFFYLSEPFSLTEIVQCVRDRIGQKSIK